VDIALEQNALETLQFMAKKNVAVEINITSNEFILGIKDGEHPIMLYVKNKVPIVLSTDDAGILRTNLTEQYVLAAMRYPELKYNDFKQMSLNSIKFSFLPDNEKKCLLGDLNVRFAQFEKSWQEEELIMWENLLTGMENQILSIIISIISMIIAVVPLIMLIIIRKTDATIELNVYDMIVNSRITLAEITATYNALEKKKGVNIKSNEEEINFIVLQQCPQALIENYLNAYEFACAEYLDKKIDRKRLKKTYQLALQKIMQNKLFQDYF
jgi:hypothetical protein